MSKVKDKDEVSYFQNIILHLKGGKTITATVPAFCKTKEDLESLHIDKIEMTKPMVLPRGSNFQVIEGE